MEAVESCPICHEEYVASDYQPCDKCERRVCDECKAWNTGFACWHKLCEECYAAADMLDDCPVCVDVDAERDEVLDVIRRS